MYVMEYLSHRRFPINGSHFHYYNPHSKVDAADIKSLFCTELAIKLRRIKEVLFSFAQKFVSESELEP